MEVWCPGSSLTISWGQSSTLPSRSSNNATLPCAPNTAGWQVCHYIRNNLPTSAVSKQISARASGYVVKRHEFGRRTPVSLPLLLDGRSRGSDTSEVGFRPKHRSLVKKTVLLPFVCRFKSRFEQDVDEGREPDIGVDGLDEGGQLARGVGQAACWVVTVVYVGWLFVLPYAPGDPAWAIKPSTIRLLVDQSLDIFFVLPLASFLTNAAGFHVLTAPVQHPTSEALFNFVIGWTFLFAPALFTDNKRDKFGGSLETLWIIQMFLTNTVLAPYMAIRQKSSPPDKGKSSIKTTLLGIDFESLGRGMTSGANLVGVTGALVGAVSVFWAFFGRSEGGFGGFAERWEYFLSYVGSERLAYAFLWDIALYAVFQPWLIGDNLSNVRAERREAVRILRFVPYVGLVVYVLGLHKQGSSEA